MKQRLDLVLTALEEANLTLQPGKCVLLQKPLDFLFLDCQPMD